MTRDEFVNQLSLEVNLIPVGKQNRSGLTLSPQFVTVHNTDTTNPGADARAHGRFLKNVGYYMWNGSKRWVSWHFTVDDERVVRHLPLGERGIHAPNGGNTKSFGIEICMNPETDRATADLRAARVVALLMYDFNLDISKVVPHRKWTTKNCPRLLMNSQGNPGQKWDAFKNVVKQEFEKID
ncbi:MAG TPA: N-acetylmuramoyl-L-alanine amidase [Pyrinomonadaceae bacterium]|nr:N-acetylmuramoyl-L-alanine amidase [Pyrinomonadaceae bacterium]